MTSRAVSLGPGCGSRPANGEVFVPIVTAIAGSSTEMRAAGTRPAAIRRLWVLIAAVCTLATVLGYAIAHNVGGNFKAIAQRG